MINNAPLLEIKHLTSSYYIDKFLFFRKTVEILHDINFTLECGQILAITGEAGSGKSTLLRIINGSETHNLKGEVLFCGKPLHDYERQDRVGFVRMFYPTPETSLNPYLRVEGLLDLPLKLNTTLTYKERQKKIAETMDYVGLSSGLKYYYPIMLTRSQLLRLSLAHALILDPQILLVDSIIERMDLQLRAHFINIFIELQKTRNTSVIICLNNLDLINHIADQMIILDRGHQAEWSGVGRLLVAPSSEIGRRILQCDKHEYRSLVVQYNTTKN